MSRHTNQSIIVTGAAGAIGYATCEILVREGAKVMLVDINAPRLAERAAALRAQGGKVEACVADCGEEADVRRYAQATIDGIIRDNCSFQTVNRFIEYNNNIEVINSKCIFYRWCRLIIVDCINRIFYSRASTSRICTCFPITDT